VIANNRNRVEIVAAFLTRGANIDIGGHFEARTRGLEATLPELFGRKTKVLFSKSDWVSSSLRWTLLFAFVLASSHTVGYKESHPVREGMLGLNI
jgi:hypothetical protein